MTEREIERLRADFPLIKQGKIIYFDNAATMQKPQVVIERVREFYESENANPLRGLYDLSVRTTELVAETRVKVAKFMGAKRAEEIVFTKSATEAINMTARMLGRKLAMDDEVIFSLKSHHSNFLPWGELQRNYKIGARLMTDEKMMTVTPNTKLIVLPGMSNVTGEETRCKRLSDIIYSMDVAQAIAHRKVDVGKEKIDFAQWSGHKIGAPMGVGVLYGRYQLLDEMEPVDLGGGMVVNVDFSPTNFSVNFDVAPQKFEAGTLNVEGILGLGTAIDYWQQHEPERLFEYIDELTGYARAELKKIPEVKLIGAKHGIVAFSVDGIHPHDVAQILADEKICVRAGYHCAQPLLDVVLGVGPVVRASFTFYNTRAEIDKMVAVLKTVRSKMGL